VAEGKKIVDIDKVLLSDNLVIPELNTWLEKRRITTQNNDQYTDDKKFSGDITIQADKHIRFRLLKKIMYTCGRQEYNNFSLAVQKRERNSSGAQ
jgi:biopolymer transport protein ExbD